MPGPPSPENPATPVPAIGAKDWAKAAEASRMKAELKRSMFLQNIALDLVTSEKITDVEGTPGRRGSEQERKGPQDLLLLDSKTRVVGFETNRDYHLKSPTHVFY